jgi:D-amino-acid oxidase
MEIIVIGGGISGLTTGLALARAGHRVSIWAREVSPRTTSDVAAALWYPYLVQPAEQVKAWGRVAYDQFRADLADPARGVIWHAGVLEAVPRPLADDALPLWRADVANFRRADPAELPQGFADGYRFDAPVIDMSIYLPYLMQAFKDAGGAIDEREIGDFSEAFALAPVVVNCAGLGARALAHDPAVYAVRGQVVRIRPTGFQQIMLADDGPLGLVYIVPRVRDIVLGGVSTERDENEKIVPEQTASILDRCRRFAPALGPVGAEDITEVACGLRPARTGGVRVAYERVAPDRHLLHNYGHGGAGVTLSWGCAAEIADLVRDLIGQGNG